VRYDGDWLLPSQFIATFRFATFWPTKRAEVAKVAATGDARAKQQVGMSAALSCEQCWAVNRYQ